MRGTKQSFNYEIASPQETVRNDDYKLKFFEIMPIRAGSCNINELVQVGVGNANPADALVYNSFMATTSKMPVFGAIISGGYKAFGIDPVGKPGIYACPADWETVYVDRRTDWSLEKRLALVAVALLLLNIFLKMIK